MSVSDAGREGETNIIVDGVKDGDTVDIRYMIPHTSQKSDPLCRTLPADGTCPLTGRQIAPLIEGKKEGKVLRIAPGISAKILKLNYLRTSDGIKPISVVLKYFSNAGPDKRSVTKAVRVDKDCPITGKKIFPFVERKMVGDRIRIGGLVATIVDRY